MAEKSDSPTIAEPCDLSIPSLQVRPSVGTSEIDELRQLFVDNMEPDVDKLPAGGGAYKTLERNGGNSGSNLMYDAFPFSSDDFRMYEFKIRRCTRGKSHDWTDCPFAHPGEKARRRDPRNYNYSGSPCPEYRKGPCKKGDSCEFAHGVFECWLHPTRYRTQPCKDGLNCSRRNCFFAHTKGQLRLLPSAMVAAAKNLREEADELERLAMFSNSLPGSPQDSCRVRRASFGNPSHLEPSLPSSFSRHHNALCLPQSCLTGETWEASFHPMTYPSEAPSANGSIFPEGISNYMNAQASQDASSNPLLRDFTWPLKQPSRLPFLQSEGSFADSSRNSSSLGLSSPSSLYRQYPLEGMDDSVHSLQALDLRQRISAQFEDRETMSANSPGQYLMYPQEGEGPGSRRSFEVPRRWKVMEDERLRRMASMGNAQFLAQQDQFSDGGSQQWSMGEPEMNDFTYAESMYPPFFSEAMNAPGLELRRENGASVIRDPWGNPVGGNSQFL